MKTLRLITCVFYLSGSILSAQDAKGTDPLATFLATDAVLQQGQEKHDPSTTVSTDHSREIVTDSPLLVVVIVVKNEATVMQRTLQPYIDAKIQHYLVFDTGSTDDTIAVTKELFAKNNIRYGFIEQEPFVNFKVSRNRALTISRERFPNAYFMVMPDAEWVMQDVPGLLKFCEEVKNDTAEGYPLRIINGGSLDYPNHRLIRTKSNAHFEGPIHEFLAGNLSNKKPPLTVYFAWTVTPLGHEKSAKRWLRDLDILRKEYETNPNDPRTVFYLAQTHDCLGNIDEACLFYEKRANMQKAWDEETFMARYRLAGMYDRKGRWELALTNYLKAYSMRPHRIEPLVCIARHYINEDNFPSGFLFAARAAEVPYPAQDGLFVDKKMYDYERFDILTRAAWYLGEFVVGERAAALALAGCPPEVRENAQRNFNCYLNRKR